MKQILPFLILLLFGSCQKEENPVPTINPYGKNTLIGYTGAYDYMSPDSNSNGGILAKVMSGNQVIATGITDSLGKFEIFDLDVGTYDIVITREGWAQYKTKSVFCGPGPNPTIVYFENDNAYGYRVNPLVRRVYSDIVSVEMDSIKSGMAYFCMTISPNQLDLVDSLKIGLIDNSKSDERLVYFCYGPKVISTNKLIFSVGYYNQWRGINKFDFVLFPYLDYAMCGSILNSRGNFEVTNAHKILQDVLVVFP